MRALGDDDRTVEFDAAAKVDAYRREAEQRRLAPRTPLRRALAARLLALASRLDATATPAGRP